MVFCFFFFKYNSSIHNRGNHILCQRVILIMKIILCTRFSKVLLIYCKLKEQYSHLTIKLCQQKKKKTNYIYNILNPQTFHSK